MPDSMAPFLSSHFGGPLSWRVPSLATDSALLEMHVYPTMAAIYGEIHEGIFQPDNAPAHKSASALQQLDIETLQWPSDLSPIELNEDSQTTQKAAKMPK